MTVGAGPVAVWSGLRSSWRGLSYVLELTQGISNPHTSNIKTFWTACIKLDLSKSFPTRKTIK